MPDPAPNPFAELGLDPRFDLERPAIDRAYASRAAAIHPDLADPDRADDATRDSARLNDARATLADPERRAVALLALLGGPGASEDRSLPDGFLMDMMDTRQRAEEECVTPEGHAKWRAWADDRRAERIDQVRALFSGLADPPDAGALAEIRKTLNAWRYVERMIEQLDPDHVPPM
ncbi:MAG: iron-sulfur cluster co-chaperone HscB C-terminal domain-containing protein [Phycisphaerales bacterium]